MASVTLKAPIKHGDEWLPAGTVLGDLTDKAAARLVRLKAAVMTKAAADPVAPPADDDDEIDTSELSSEEAAEIKQMKKSALIEALEKAGAPLTGSENTADLRTMLMRVWSQPGVDGVNDQ